MSRTLLETFTDKTTRSTKIVISGIVLGNPFYSS
jgi:hypothetical protein